MSDNIKVGSILRVLPEYVSSLHLVPPSKYYTDIVKVIEVVEQPHLFYTFYIVRGRNWKKNLNRQVNLNWVEVLYE